MLTDPFVFIHHPMSWDYAFFSPLSTIKLFSVSLPLSLCVSQVQLLESLNWVEQVQRRKPGLRKHKNVPKNKSDKAIKFLVKEEREERNRTMGRKKIQITRIMDERNRQVRCTSRRLYNTEFRCFYNFQECCPFKPKWSFKNSTSGSQHPSYGPWSTCHQL